MSKNVFYSVCIQYGEKEGTSENWKSAKNLENLENLEKFKISSIFGNVRFFFESKYISKKSILKTKIFWNVFDFENKMFCNFFDFEKKKIYIYFFVVDLFRFWKQNQNVKNLIFSDFSDVRFCSPSCSFWQILGIKWFSGNVQFFKIVKNNRK